MHEPDRPATEGGSWRRRFRSGFWRGLAAAAGLSIAYFVVTWLTRGFPAPRFIPWVLITLAVFSVVVGLLTGLLSIPARRFGHREVPLVGAPGVVEQVIHQAMRRLGYQPDRQEESAWVYSDRRRQIGGPATLEARLVDSSLVLDGPGRVLPYVLAKLERRGLVDVDLPWTAYHPVLFVLLFVAAGLLLMALALFAIIWVS